MDSVRQMKKLIETVSVNANSEEWRKINEAFNNLSNLINGGLVLYTGAVRSNYVGRPSPNSVAIEKEYQGKLIKALLDLESATGLDSEL